MHLKAFIFVILLIAGLTSHAQITYSTKQLLLPADSLTAQLLLRQNLQFLTDEKQNLALVNEIEFRTETDEMDLSRQEYMMRLGLSSRKSRSVQDAITQNHLQYYQLQEQAAGAKALIERYELILDWQQAQAKSQYLKGMKPLLVDQKTIFQSALENSLDLDIKDLLKVENELQALERDLSQLRLKQASIAQQLLGENMNDTISLDTSDWIGFNTMRFVLTEIDSIPNQNLELAIQQTELDFEKLNLDLERAEGSQILDFVQLKYSGRETQTIQQEFSLGLGLRIPTKASSRQKVNEAQLDLFDEQYKQSLLQAKITQRIENYYTVFGQLEAAYQMLQQQIKAKNWEATLESYRNAGVVSPLNLLLIKETILKDQRALQKLEDEARLVFIKILAIKGLLYQSPRTNYLSEKLDSY